MPTAKKTKSGSWTVRVFSHTEIVNGRELKKYKSITVRDGTLKGKRECERLAAEYALNKQITRDYPTIKSGMEHFIETKSNVLSPATLRSYASMSKSAYTDIEDIAMNLLTKERLQRWVNDRAKDKSPKTIKNNIAFLSSVYDMYELDMPKAKIPQQEVIEYILPSKEEIRTLLDYCADNDPELEIAVMLGAFCGLRRAEILALTNRSLKGRQLTINSNIVRGIGKIERKSTKTRASTRVIEVPDFVADRLKGIKGRYVSYNPEQLTNRFNRTRDRLELSHFRFHDLRHWGASTLIESCPIQYVEQWGGWRPGSQVLKSVYLNTSDEAKKHFSNIANNKFLDIIKGDSM